MSYHLPLGAGSVANRWVAGSVKARESGRCCTGFKTVFEILAEHYLCNYHAWDNSVGLSMKRRAGREGEFAVFEDATVAQQFLTSLLCLTLRQSQLCTGYRHDDPLGLLPVARRAV